VRDARYRPESIADCAAGTLILGVFYLFATKLLGGPGFTYKQSNQLKSKALWWWADIAVKACALGFVVVFFGGELVDVQV